MFVLAPRTDSSKIIMQCSGYPGDINPYEQFRQIATQIANMSEEEFANTFKIHCLENVTISNRMAV